MTTPKRHHYIPEFYLHNFCRDGLLWVFDRKQNQYRKQTPINTAIQSNYYTIELSNGEKHVEIEKMLSIVEGAAKPIIEKLQNGELINDEEKLDLSLFISFMKSRVPDFEKTVDEMTGKMMKKITKMMFATEEMVEQIIKQTKGSSEVDTGLTAKDLYEFAQSDNYKINATKNHTLHMMLSSGIDLADYFYQMDWLLCHTPSKSSFITTDNPFTLLPPSDYKKDHFWGFGICTAGTRKLIPLSQTCCMIMFDKGDKIIHREVTREQVRSINLSVTANCDRFVISRDEALIFNLVNKTGINRKEKISRVRVN